MTSYDFKEGQLIRLFHGVPEEAWIIYQAPTDVLRDCIKWNDRDGDFDELERVTILEIFLHDFIVNKANN